MRYRTRYSFSNGSMWMSEAPRLMASVEDDVDQADDRRLLGLLLQLLEIDLLIVVEHLEVAGADVVLVQVVHHLLELDRVGGAVEALDRGAQRLLGGHHRLDVVAGHELDVVHARTRWWGRSSPW